MRRGGYRPRGGVILGAPWALDLFCGAGGYAMGLHYAGWNVIGVDIKPQPHYPFTFVQANALDVLDDLIMRGNFDTLQGPPPVSYIHASPPCQAYSDLQKQSKMPYPEYIGPVRQRLLDLDIPWTIENVEGAPLIDPVMLCGTAFNELRVIRHRLFESNLSLLGTMCPPRHPLVFTFDKRKPHHKTTNQWTDYVQVTGGGNCRVENKRDAMGIDWMTGKECNEAIPPAYGEFIGRQIRRHIT